MSDSKIRYTLINNLALPDINDLLNYLKNSGSGSSVEFLEITETQIVDSQNVPLLTLDNIVYIQNCFKNKKHIIILWYETIGSELHTHYLNVISCNEFNNQVIIVTPTTTDDYEIKYFISNNVVMTKVKSYAWKTDIEKIKGLKDFDYLSFLNDDGDLQYISFYSDVADFGLNISAVVIDNNKINSCIQLLNFGDTFTTHSDNEEITIAKIKNQIISVANANYSTIMVRGRKIPITISVSLENGKIINCLGLITTSSSIENEISIFWNSELNGITPKYINIPIQLFLQEQSITNLLKATNKAVDENIKLEKHWSKMKAKKGK